MPIKLGAVEEAASSRKKLLDYMSLSEEWLFVSPIPCFS